MPEENTPKITEVIVDGIKINTNIKKERLRIGHGILAEMETDAESSKDDTDEDNNLERYVGDEDYPLPFKKNGGLKVYLDDRLLADFPKNFKILSIYNLNNRHFALEIETDNRREFRVSSKKDNFESRGANNSYEYQSQSLLKYVSITESGKITTITFSGLRSEKESRPPSEPMEFNVYNVTKNEPELNSDAEKPKRKRKSTKKTSVPAPCNLPETESETKPKKRKNEPAKQNIDPQSCTPEVLKVLRAIQRLNVKIMDNESYITDNAQQAPLSNMGILVLKPEAQPLLESTLNQLNLLKFRRNKLFKDLAVVLMK